MALDELAHRLLIAGICAEGSENGLFAARFFYPAFGVETWEIFVHGVETASDRVSADSLRNQLGSRWSNLIDVHRSPAGDVFLGDQISVTRHESEWILQNASLTRIGASGPQWSEVRFATYDLQAVEEAVWNYYFGVSLRVGSGWYLPVHRRPDWQREHIIEAFQSAATISSKTLRAVMSEREGFAYFGFPHSEAEPFTLRVRSDGREMFIIDERIDGWLEWATKHGKAISVEADGRMRRVSRQHDQGR